MPPPDAWMRHLARALPPGWRLPPQDPLRVRTAAGAVEWSWEPGRCDGGERHDAARSPEGLRLSCATVVLPEGAAEVRCTLRNAGAAPVVCALLQPLHLTVVHGGDPVHARVVGGGVNERVYPPRAFRAETLRFDGGGFLWTENGHDGRSSDRHLPLLAASAGEGGVVAGLAWSGLWWGSVGGTAAGELTLAIRIPVRDLRLEPGEELALPAAHIVCSPAGGLAGAQNACRRHLNRRVLPRRIVPPASYNHWFGLGPGISAERLSPQVAIAAELGLEHVVVDAGWYPGCLPDDFDAGVGNLAEVDRGKFPAGLLPLAERVRAHGMGFGLWFELERAHRASRWARERPELFWDDGGDFLHLDLTRRDAQDAAIDLVVGHARSLGLSWIKLDYNIGPRRFWERADASGKVQFAYLAGLDRVGDAILRACPGAIVECCASGGRRLDLGMLRRSHTALISDHCHVTPITAFMQAGANLLLPGQVANAGLAVEDDRAVGAGDIMARTLGACTVFGDLTRLDAASRRAIADGIARFKSFRHLLGEDHHALLPQPAGDGAWQADEFAAGDAGEALVLAFPAYAGGGGAAVRPVALHPAAAYEVRVLHAADAPATRSGADLMRVGLAAGGAWSGWLLRRLGASL